MKKFILLLIVLLSCRLYSQQKMAEYIDLSPNFFNEFQLPIGITVFPFTNNNSETDLDEKFYNKLSVALGKQSKYIINIHKKLGELLNSWGIKSWDPKNQKLLKKLNSELEIKLVVYALVDEGGSSLQLKVINTLNGKEMYSFRYLPSKNSTAIEDAVYLFTKNKTVRYKEVEESGSLSVRTKPEEYCQVYIDDRYVGETPLVLKDLKKGNYKLSIKDSKEVYEPYTLNFAFTPDPKNTVEKIIPLSAISGSLQINVSPYDADVEVYNKKNVLVKQGAYLGKIDGLVPGEYKIKVNKKGFETASETATVRKNSTTRTELNLQRILSKKYIVKEIIGESSYLKQVTLKREENKYRIEYTLKGEADDEFNATLYLTEAKSSSKRKLRELTGDYDNVKNPNASKVLYWDFEKEIPAGMEGKELYLRLVVEKSGGGIPWYVWAGGVIAGGAATYFIIHKPNDDAQSGQVNIPAPPTRPGN